MNKPKFLDRVRDVARMRHLSLRTEEAYCDWIRRFILFHQKRHPSEMGANQIRQFLTYLAVEANVAASTQNQALCALLFLYREVLRVESPYVEGIERAKRPARVPVVFTRQEVEMLLAQLAGTPKLIASLLYGSGLRLVEALRLRVKDVDFEYQQITVRSGKGEKGSAHHSTAATGRASAVSLIRAHSFKASSMLCSPRLGRTSESSAQRAARLIAG